MRTKEQVDAIVEALEAEYPLAECALEYEKDYELLFSVRLSAQCTDARVNMITPALYERFPTLESFAEAEQEEVEDLIRSCGFYHTKARDIVLCARMLIERFDGKVPGTMEELLTLPGVGRKTANVMASVVWNEPVIAVDTHVFRVSRRLGLSRGRTPEAVEKDLERHTPAELRPICHHWLILHGRYTCTAKSPKCGDCPLRPWCRTYEKSIL